MKTLKFNESYRPKMFKDVLGQKDNLKILDNSIKMNQVQNAYIFYGQFGLGKTTVARIFANKLICLNLDENNEPCGRCEACKEFKVSPYTAGVIEIDGASNANINEIRALKTNVAYSPKYKYNVVIIDEAQDVKGPGASALFKILEEPPENTVFILATTEYESIPGAIRSRCTPLFFHPATVDDLKMRLKHICLEQEIKATDNSLELIAKSSNGCVRDALKTLQQASVLSKCNITDESLIGIIDCDKSRIEELVKLIIKGDTVNTSQYISDNIKNVTEKHFDMVAEYIRDLMINNQSLNPNQKTTLIQIANKFLEYKRDLGMYANNNMALEFSVIESCAYMDRVVKDRKSFIKSLANTSKNTMRENSIRSSKKLDNTKIEVDKGELFVKILKLSNSDLKNMLNEHIIKLNPKDSVLEFCVESEDDKNMLREILNTEIYQKLKPILEIKGFRVRLKNNNQ